MSPFVVAALASTLHIASISAAVAFSALRLVALRRQDQVATRFADNGNGLAAIGLYGSGLWRLFGDLEKPLAFYTANHVFWLKMSLLGVVALLEVYPQVVVLPWHFRHAAGKPIEPKPGQFERMFRLAALQFPVLLGVAVCASLMSRGLGLPEAPPPAAPSSAVKGAMPEQGAAVYARYCQACHQPDGRGLGGTVAADFAGHPAVLAKSDEELLRSIRQGITGPKVMPPWGTVLSVDEQREVLRYLRWRFSSLPDAGMVRP